MKTLLTTSIALFLLLLTTETRAQLSIGPGIAFGTDVDELGIQVRGIYSITDQWRAGADIIYYLDSIKDFSIWEINLNAQYVFTDAAQLKAYALAGFNILLFSDSFFGENSTSTEAGLNLGVGGQYLFSDKVSGLAELKYTLSDLDQLVIGLGIQFHLGG